MSRPEQIRGDSLRRQTQTAQAWAERRSVRIDDTIRDIGVSAYRGKNRTAGALAAFLRLVDDGTVERGSYLIVESLDRLSREAVLDTLPRFIDLVQAGIVIVTLADGQEYSEARLKADWTPLVLSLAVMARAHEESRTKSMRVVEAWDRKRATAKDRVVTARVPAWLEVADGHVREIAERADLVRRIFAETLAGYGRRTICRRLNVEAIPAFSGEKGWHPSYVAKVLANRAVIGEFQAYRRIDGVRRAEGEPVPGYFPAIVGEADFLRATRSVRARASAPGRRGVAMTNLFLGLARCETCGSTMGLENKGRPPKGARYLVCSNARRAAGCDNGRRWRLDIVEKKVLGLLIHMDPEELIGRRHTTGPDPAAGLRTDLEKARKARSTFLDLVEAGDDEAAARARDMIPKIKDLEARLATSERERATVEAVPTVVRELHAAINMARGLVEAEPEEVGAVRRRIAQGLREALSSVAFTPHTVMLRYKTARANKGPIRRVPSPGQPLPPLEVVVIDETPGRIPSWAREE